MDSTNAKMPRPSKNFTAGTLSSMINAGDKDGIRANMQKIVAAKLLEKPVIRGLLTNLCHAMKTEGDTGDLLDFYQNLLCDV